MKKQLLTILSIIPQKFKQTLPSFVSLSFINLLLELISIAYLIPIFLLILDHQIVLDKISDYVNLNETDIPFIVAFFIITFIIKNLIQIQINKYQSHFVFKIATELSSKFLNRFLTKNYLDFQKKNTAESLQNIKIVGADFSNHILLSVNTFFTEGFVIFIILGISSYFYLKLTLIVLGIVSVVFVFLLFIRKKKIVHINNSLRDSYYEITSQLLNIIQGFLELKSLKKEPYFYNKFNRSVRDFNEHYAKLNIYKQSNNKYLEILMVVGLTLVLLFLTQNKNSVNSNVFLLSFIAGSAMKLLPSINKIIIAYTNFQAFKYTIDILKETSESPQKTISIKNSFGKNIVLKDISFQYNSKKIILERVNLTVLKGEIIGVSGNSGIGKTTLLNIIMNLLEPQCGNVYIDELKVSNHHNLFNLINYLPQNPFIFEGSVIDNIVLGQDQEEIDFDRIYELSSILELDNIIKSEDILSLDINSLKISGGQKQRLALLRALYHDFEIIILDEATNQLDKNLEDKVLSYFLELKKQEKTIVLVSHNSKVKEISDQYFILKNNSLFVV